MADSFTASILGFGRLLRGDGVDVHHSRLLDALRALEWVGIERRDDVRATLRGLLVHRHEDLSRFDRAFDAYFAANRRATSESPGDQVGAGGHLVADRRHVGPGASAGEESSDSPVQNLGAYSASGVSRTKDFADFTAAELEQARELLARLPWELGWRRTRRWEPARGGRIDLRPMIRRALSRGDVIDLVYRRKRVAPSPIVVIGDVSGSMERYSRILLHFVHGLARNTRRVEAFVFSTTLTRISRRIAAGGANRHLNRTIRDVQDWGGGTRIGEALRLFNTRWARRVMRHGPVVLLVSDGWDRGDPALLSREIVRLRRSCRRLIWLNPLLGTANYQPLTRGMQAALPFVDDFLPVHNIESLEQLAMHLQPRRRRVR